VTDAAQPPERIAAEVRARIARRSLMPSPSVWDQVVGHGGAVAVLRDAVESGRVVHAWLFVGPPGVGKLHAARVFAAALNCPSGGDGTCDVCRRVLRGVHPDVHLLAPEGDNLLVDDVRAVREEASRSHHEARVAVFVLDEVDRMTDAAANALLKVLEEPPAGVVFVLVARSADALVGTIPSRARTLRFTSLPAAAMTAALAEELGIAPEQVAWAAAASHGRLAKARSLLSDEAARLRRATALDLAEQLGEGRASAALNAATTVLGLADEVMAAGKQRQVRELAEFEETYGKGRGSATLRKRIETRHRRELRRIRFDAIREAVSDLLGVYRDMAALRGAAPPGAEPGGRGPGEEAGPGEGARVAGGTGPADSPRLVHPDRAATTARLATALDPAAAIRAAAALEEADRRLSIGAAPQLTLEAAFLSVQAALRGPSMPISRLAIR
jgi:DNA polymerase-3 subunit delta'